MTRRILFYTITIFLTGFALITLFFSASVIFDLFGIRSKEGNYVLFVVWANFISSLLYLFSVYGLLTAKRWSYQLLVATVALLMVAFVGLVVHINTGGIYEGKTVIAMVFRIIVTIGFSNFAYYTINAKKKMSA